MRRLLRGHLEKKALGFVWCFGFILLLLHDRREEQGFLHESLGSGGRE